jgi:putative two-component system response regulator
MTGAIAQDATNILIVDDKPENLDVLDGLLRAAGYRVRAANNGRSALRLAQDTDVPSLILLDVMMPGMNGYAVLEALRADLQHPGHFRHRPCRRRPLKSLFVLARVRTQLQAKLARDLLRDQNAWLEQEVARRMTENDRIQAVSIRASRRR